MAKVSAKSAVILVDGYNLSTYFTSYEASDSVNPAEVTGFGDGSNNFIPTVKTSAITGSALWDNEALKSRPILQAAAGGTTDRNVTIIPEGAAGGASLSLVYTEGGITPSGSPTAAISLGTINFSAMGSYEGLEHGECLFHGTDTNSTTGTAYTDPQAAGPITARCSGTLHVWQAAASDTYSIKIQDSPDNSTWADLVTFTLNGSAIGSERVAVASGNVDYYHRILTARTGAAGDTLGFTVHFWREPTVTT